MPRNIEIKARVKDLDEVKRIASGLSGTDGEIIKQRDVFFQLDSGKEWNFGAVQIILDILGPFVKVSQQPFFPSSKCLFKCFLKINIIVIKVFHN